MGKHDDERDAAEGAAEYQILSSRGGRRKCFHCSAFVHERDAKFARLLRGRGRWRLVIEEVFDGARFVAAEMGQCIPHDSFRKTHIKNQLPLPRGDMIRQRQIGFAVEIDTFRVAITVNSL
jgi:hypothetical protein